LENSGLGHAAVLPEPSASGEPRISKIRALQQNLWVNFGSGRSPSV
jgi:hypothetical protein